MVNKVIRAMTIEDLDAVCNIEYQCFKSKYTRKEFENELLDNPFAKLWVLQIDQEIVGYIDYWITFESGQLCKIAVNPNKQGNHYADLLMEFLHQDCMNEGCETLSLEVRVSNQKAIKLYEKYNYINVNTRKNYYEDGEDAYLMVKGV